MDQGQWAAGRSDRRAGNGTAAPAGDRGRVEVAPNEPASHFFAGPYRVPDLDERDGPPEGPPAGDPAEPPWSGAPVDSALSDTPRYEIRSLIAGGSEGQVYLTYDHDLRRRVAMKILRPEFTDKPTRVERFIAEARRTSHLEHPGIPSVYDIGRTATGEHFFTMRLVQGETLAKLLTRFHRGDAATRKEWSLVRLVQLLQSVANAIDHAHSRGLVHRDLKPANIAVGRHGDVLVLDWGLAKRIGPDPDSNALGQTQFLRGTQVGSVKGTPLYMAPEQAVGAVDSIGPHTDVFALGAILYEMLCGVPPYEASNYSQVLMDARAGKIESPEERCKGRLFPRVLVKAVMKALALDASERHPTAAAFAADLQSFIEGSRDAGGRRVEASTEAKLASDMARIAASGSAEARRLESEIANRRRAVSPGATRDATRDAEQDVGELEQRLEVVVADIGLARARTIEHASRALALDAGNVEARKLLAEVYLRRYQDARRSGNRVLAGWLRLMAKRHNDGEFDDDLQDATPLLVSTSPPGARVTITKCLDAGDASSDPGDGRSGDAPLATHIDVDCTSIVTVERPGYATARIPVVGGPAGRSTLRVRLVPESRVPEGFVHVPSGSFLSEDGGVLSLRSLPDYLIGRFPVTLGEYALWLGRLREEDPAAAESRTPRVEGIGALLHWDGAAYVARTPAIFSKPGEHPLPDFPVVGVTADDALAYARDLAESLGMAVGLPDEFEWEKAARGTDGRMVPWGEASDVTPVRVSDACGGAPLLRRIGHFPQDRSPYLVRDMAGGVREWCARRGEPDEEPRYVCRGGACDAFAARAPLSMRWFVPQDERSLNAGFRLVIRSP